jgi:ABC-type polysaccharide/polyol phosphate transport system ATPase subunit
MLANGATLLFVSHSADSVKALCRKALWLREGHVVMSGGVDEVCDTYEQTRE